MSLLFPHPDNTQRTAAGHIDMVHEAMATVAAAVIRLMAHYYHSGYRDQSSRALAQLHQVTQTSEVRDLAELAQVKHTEAGSGKPLARLAPTHRCTSQMICNPHRCQTASPNPSPTRNHHHPPNSATPLQRATSTYSPTNHPNQNHHNHLKHPASPLIPQHTLNASQNPFRPTISFLATSGIFFSLPPNNL